MGCTGSGHLTPQSEVDRIGAMESKDYLGVGLYTMSDAARILKVPRRTLARWVEGYSYHSATGKHFYKPVLDSNQDGVLTFGDLIELRYIKGLRKLGVKLDVIRRVSEKYRKEWQVQYPLATRRFGTDGKSLLLVIDEHTWSDSLTGQLASFFTELQGQIVFCDDTTKEWRPLGIERSIVINPQLAFGKPIEERSGAHTYVLAKAYKVEKDAKKVADWYETSAEAVMDAVRYEHQLSA